MMRGWLAVLGSLAGLLGASGVGLAAAGAHLSGDPVVATAANFLLFHAAALVGLCAVAARRPDAALLAAGSMIALGALLFSGDLAVRGLAGVVLIHKAAPAGGLFMIAGWLLASLALPLTLRRSFGPSEPR